MTSRYDDLMAEAGVPVLKEHLGEEDIEYLYADGLQETIMAIVDRTPDLVGFSGDRGRSPIRVWIADADITTVAEGEDRVIVDAKKYRIEEIFSHQGGLWDVFCSS